MRRALVAALGLTVLAAGGWALIDYQRTPAVLLGHPDPHPGTLPELGALLPAPVALPAEPPASRPPAAVRQGTWIEIPSLGVAVPVRRGDGSDRIPDGVALIYPDTASPGQPGNSYLYGHGYWDTFGPLLYARRGDTVLVHDYTRGLVSQLHVSRVVGRIAWSDTSWLRARSASPTVTLQTCVGIDPRSDRWIVVAS